MGSGLIQLLMNDPVAFALVAIPLLYSVMLHEVAHGWVAFRFGDPTAKMLGRLSLNPLLTRVNDRRFVTLLPRFRLRAPSPIENLMARSFPRQRRTVFRRGKKHAATPRPAP